MIRVLISLLGNFLKFVALENNDSPVFNLNDARALPYAKAFVDWLTSGANEIAELALR